MARSASRGVAAALALFALAGCDSTQERNARAEIAAKREILARAPQRITRENPQVDVTGVTLLRGGPRDPIAVVVDLRSRATAPLTDLPISIGLRSGGRTVALNAKGGQDWFQTHVPAIAPGGAATWVFTGRRPAAAKGRPFAIVGMPEPAPFSRADTLPRLGATAVPGAAGATARVRVENSSGLPQDSLQVYALARAGARYVAAGKASVEHLDRGRQATVDIPLIGGAQNLQPLVYAIPTTFR